MREQAKGSHRGDSFVVHVTPPAGNTPPMVRIIRRRRKRQPGKVAEERTIETLGGREDFEGDRINEVARKIGLAILSDSPIIRAWRSGKRARPAPEDRALRLLREIGNSGGKVSATEFQTIAAHLGYDQRGAGVLFRNYLRRCGDEVELTDAGYDRLGDFQLLPKAKRIALPTPIVLPGKPLSDYVSEARE